MQGVYKGNEQKKNNPGIQINSKPLLNFLINE